MGVIGSAQQTDTAHMIKTYNTAGTSVLKGTLTYRFANNGPKARAKVLERNGHTDVQLKALPTDMTVEDAVAWLNAQGIYAEHTKKHVNVAKATAVQVEQVEA